MARVSPDNTRTQPDLSGDILTRTDRTNAFRHVRLSGVRLASNPEDRGPKDFEVNPMNRYPSQRVAQMNDAPRCGARTRSGAPCRCPAMPNGKCRIHGGLSPGAPRGVANGRYTDGYWTREAVEERRFVRSLLKAGLNLGVKS